MLWRAYTELPLAIFREELDLTIGASNGATQSRRQDLQVTTICLINQKGGCGKTSTCLHLAGAFAALGRVVLLVDADPQGSLSQAFLGSSTVEQLPADHTVAALFDQSRFVSDPQSLVVPTAFENIMLVPANQHLGAFNTPCPQNSGMLQFVLKNLLDEFVEFDLTLIDCPPNLYACSWAAMVAADFVVIPVPPEDFGTQGLRAVHQAIEQARVLNPSLRRMGHLVTRCDRRLLIHCAYEKRLRANYDHMVLQTVIPEASAFKVAVAARKPVEQHDPRSAAAGLTRQLASEIENRIAAHDAKQRAA